jgi:hypothetical protein
MGRVSASSLALSPYETSPANLLSRYSSSGVVPFGQRRGQRAERARCQRLTGTLMPAWAAQAQSAEQCAHDDGMRMLVGPRSATAGARHLLGQACTYLLVDQGCLHLLQKLLRFVKVPAERVDRQRVAVDLRHLMDLANSWRCLP